MDRSVMESAIAQLVDGRCTFEEFVCETLPRWRTLAKRILRRWRAPASFGVEDAVQEMLFAAARFAWLWDSRRGVTRVRFVEWNCVNEAKYALHSARGVSLHGNPDRERSVLELPFSSFANEGAAPEWSNAIEDLLAYDATSSGPPPEIEAFERRENVLANCRSVEEIIVMRAVEEVGSVAGAVAAVWGNRRRRRLVRARSLDDVARIVVRTVDDVAGRLGVSKVA